MSAGTPGGARWGRVLFCAPPGLGHLLPLVPLAWALRCAGRPVLFATTGPARDAVRHAGLAVHDVSPDGSAERFFAERSRETLVPGLSDDQLLAGGVRLFGGVGELMLDETVAVARRWRADTVVYPPAHAVALVVSAATGIPAVLHNLGLTRATGRTALTLPALTDGRHRHGLDHVDPEPSAVLDNCPDSMRPDGVAPGRPLRYVPYDGGAVLPPWLTDPVPERARVCVTLGSRLPELGGGRLDTLLAGLAPTGAEIVLASTEDPGPVPDGVRTAGWLPLSALLPSCRAVVHHGGSGTTFTALAAGVPQVVLPHGADQPWNAAAVTARGAGVALEPETAGPGEIADALAHVLGDEAVGKAAAEVRDEISRAPGPAEVVRGLG